MCESGEFDVEEEVGRWSTDGRWDGVSPPAAPGQILAQTAARHCAAAARKCFQGAARKCCWCAAVISIQVCDA